MKSDDRDLLQLCDFLGIVVIDVLVEEFPKEEMLMSSRVIAERTPARFSADTGGNGSGSSGSFRI